LIGGSQGGDRFAAKFKIQKPLGVFQTRMGGSESERRNPVSPVLRRPV
jgi:hypothetical protein